jgi:hypothetical protein
VDKIAEDDAKFKRAMLDLASELDVDAKKKYAESKRLNIIRLTKWSDLRKWTKVNCNGGLLTSSMSKILKGLDEKTEKLWTSTKQTFTKRDSAEVEVTLAATQLWLLAAAIPAGMAAMGIPWLMLKVANDKNGMMLP